MKKLSICIVILLSLFLIGCENTSTTQLTTQKQTTEISDTISETTYLTSQTVVETSTTLDVTATTEQLLEPNFYVDNISFTNSFISFDIACDDDNIEFDIQTATLINAETYELVETQLSRDHHLQFLGLEPSTNYYIEVSLSYKLIGTETSSLSLFHFYQETNAPNPVTITNIILTKSSVTFDIEIYDPTGEGVITIIELRNPDTDEVLDSLPVETLTGLMFFSLDADTEYTIYVYYENNMQNPPMPFVVSSETWKRITTED